MTWWKVEQESWLRSTRQVWKWHVCVALVFLTVASGAVWVLQPSEGALMPGSAVIGSFLLSIGWMVLAFRCPTCGCRVGLFVLRNVAADDLLYAFGSMRMCPCCEQRRAEHA